MLNRNRQMLTTTNSVEGGKLEVNGKEKTMNTNKMNTYCFNKCASVAIRNIFNSERPSKAHKCTASI